MRLITFIAVILAQSIAFAAPSLTIYNQNFAVVRETVPLDLKDGPNQVHFADATMYMEPSSVILRDPTGQHQIQIVEQKYQGDPISQQMLLSLNEGKTIEFESTTIEAGQKTHKLILGKIIRAGHESATTGYSGDPVPSLQPIIEVEGKLRFGLPGQPIFPALGDNSILKPSLLKPSLHWLINNAGAARFNADLSYVTGEISWEADYNLVMPEIGHTVELAGWVTMDNHCGKSFENARIELMAGDVSKFQFTAFARRDSGAGGGGGGGGGGGALPPVTERSFDDYHLYQLQRSTTLLDHEKKQIEFVRASEINTSVFYVYDGWTPIESSRAYQNQGSPVTAPEYGTNWNKKVWIMLEFTNSVANHLGMPMPKGQLRVFRRNGDQMEFTGESMLEHTPRDEPVSISTGSAFDVVGERRRTDFKVNISLAIDPATGLPIDQAPPNIDPVTGLPISSPAASQAGHESWPGLDEAFEITLHNHKTESVNVRVVEHLYRWVNWNIKMKTDAFRKTDAQTIEFPVNVPPSATKVVKYTVHYSW